MNIFKKKTAPKDALRKGKREMSVATRVPKLSLCTSGSYQNLSSPTCSAAATNYKFAGESCPDQRGRNSYEGSTSISTGMKGATKAMVVMNKVHVGTGGNGR